MRGDLVRLFTFRLARHLGMTRAELMARMSHAELMEQIAYNRIEPIPDPWLQTGIVASILYNSWQKGSRKRPSDWIPARRVSMREQSPEEMSAIMAGIARAMEAQAALAPAPAPAPEA
jgi:hypothetical protein